MVNNDVLPTLGLSDHACLRFNYNCYCPTNQTSTPHYNTHRADVVRMRQMLADINWEDLLSALDTQSALDTFALRFTNVINDCDFLGDPSTKEKSIYDTNCTKS